MEFEKWQALGNDYVILEAAALPFPLTPGRVRAICAPHTGVFADGVLLLSDPDASGCLARLRIFNPDGSEAEVSGNGAREAILYIHRRGWTDSDEFSIQTAAGVLRPRVTSPRTCTVDMGVARVQSGDYPSGAEDGLGELTSGGRRWRFQHVNVGNPQCAIAVGGVAELAALELEAIGPGIERHELFPNRTNVSWFAELDPTRPDRIRARIFERGAGETASSGTGATGAAIAYVLDRRRRAGEESAARAAQSVTVVLDGGELEVGVGESLEVSLTGWAQPVFTGTMSDDFLEELDAVQ